MTKKGVAEILRKVGPGMTPFELAGVVSVETEITIAGLLRWVNLDGVPVFWVGIVAAVETPHILLCHWIADDGETIRLRGIHGDEVFEARILYSQMRQDLAFDDSAILKKLVPAARDFRVIGPEAGDKEVVPVLNKDLGSQNPYL